MSWRWSRLSSLVFLVLLYVSPLSSGDKGLWLSVADLPVQVFAGSPDRLPAEHTIVLPDRGGLVRTPAAVERREPSTALPERIADGPTPAVQWRRVNLTPTHALLGTVASAPATPRAPPA